MGYLTLKVNKEYLEDHVRRICRRNLKRPAKICTMCPILGPVIEIMENYGWKYNKDDLKEAVKKYG